MYEIPNAENVWEDETLILWQCKYYKIDKFRETIINEIIQISILITLLKSYNIKNIRIYL